MFDALRSFVILLGIAGRNLWRQRRRTLITVSALLIGVAVVIILSSMRNAFTRMLLEDAINTQAGAFQVHVTGYMDSDQGAPLDMNLDADGPVVDKLLAVPGVSAVSPRIRFSGMVSSGSTATMFVGTGIDPVQEYTVCPAAGKRAVDADGNPSTPVNPDREDGIIIGKGLADGLGVGVGDVVTLLVQTEAGGMNALDATILSFAPPSNPFESKRMIIASLPFVQRLVRMEGRATELVVGTTSFDAIPAVAGAARSALGVEYEVHTWDEVVTFARDAIERQSYVLGIVSAVLLFIVLAGIMNTVLMSVHERVREIGTMMALGMRRRSILGLFLSESLGICAVGSAAGMALGLSIVGWLNSRGIPIVLPAGGFDAILRPFIYPSFLLVVVGVAFVGGLVAAIYPAWAASRQRPVEALRAL